MLDFAEINNGEDWELFARDFLQLEGFFIETNLDRGTDGGKDFLVSETIKGKVGQYKFTWLVSCKHKAVSKRAVSEADEPNILERVKSFNADGFIGIYTTVPSSGLNNRLKQLKENQVLKDYKVFDHKMIENIMLGIGYSTLMARYLPVSYNNVKPLHIIFGKYEALNCDNCGKDLLMEMTRTNFNATIVHVTGENLSHILDIYVACQPCDHILQYKFRNEGLNTIKWNSLNDLLNTATFLRYLMATLNNLRNGTDTYDDKAFTKEKGVFLRLAQKVMREMNQIDKERHDLLSYNII